MKNVTLALDERVLAAGREYARQHRTSLNRLIRQLLEKTVTSKASESDLSQFFQLADKAAGNSHGRRWKREDLYDV
jgi:ribosomal protein S3AE